MIVPIIKTYMRGAPIKRFSVGAPLVFLSPVLLAAGDVRLSRRPRAQRAGDGGGEAAPVSFAAVSFKTSARPIGKGVTTGQKWAHSERRVTSILPPHCSAFFHRLGAAFFAKNFGKFPFFLLTHPSPRAVTLPADEAERKRRQRA